MNVRGSRVGLTEVEGALLRVPGVANASVVTDDAQPDDVRLVAYVVLAQGSDLTAEELRRQTVELLPDDLVPALFQFVPALSLTDTGEVARAALAAPDESAQEPIPRSEALPPLEAWLLEQFRQALGKARAGSQDDFFELGGDSLQAARLVNRISAAGGEWLPPTLLFDAGTVVELAELLRRRFPELAEKLSG